MKQVTELDDLLVDDRAGSDPRRFGRLIGAATPSGLFKTDIQNGLFNFGWRTG
jgi:hypothetical protein